ncbi:hypothetical protein FACS1894139_02840 [Planctomycetales bacterium]|nr:hypothetical protein FACS1894108_12190 [Planctomycetales bacterium]GHT03173.1 hypothetical protein FACS1894139_02840 [Planctomycetales bacterium]GHV21384.1 hypothetical protein AGMMS49959_10420 [Planctomycetales bacterium]
MHLLLIALGGALGSVARFLVTRAVNSYLVPTLPLGTLVVNVAGSFVIGLWCGRFENFTAPPTWRLFVTVGFLGGFTTFSTYALETVQLLLTGDGKTAAINLLAQNLLGLAAAVGGIFLGRALSES